MEPRICTKCGKEGDFYEGRNRHCKPCIRLATKAWKEANPEGVKAQRERNRGQQDKRVRAWQANNPEKVLAHNRRACARWREANRELYRARANEWAKNNPEHGKMAQSKRRAQLRGYKGPDYTELDLRACITAQDGCCWYCGFRLPVTAHVDHVQPLSREGGNGADNIVLSCPPCNQSKGKKLLGLEWIPPLMKLSLDKYRNLV